MGNFGRFCILAGLLAATFAVAACGVRSSPRHPEESVYPYLMPLPTKGDGTIASEAARRQRLGETQSDTQVPLIGTGGYAPPASAIDGRTR